MLTLFEKINVNNFDAQAEQESYLSEAYINSLLIHLQQLLNARRQSVEEVMLNDKSSLVLNYGMPDLSQFNPRSQADREMISEHIRHLIETFEPRLERVRVHLVEEDKAFMLNLHFRIEAITHINNETITFYFELDPVTHKLMFKGEK